MEDLSFGLDEKKEIDYILKEKKIISDYIIITKDHFNSLHEEYSHDDDLNYFIDFDLAILGLFHFDIFI